MPKKQSKTSILENEAKAAAMKILKDAFNEDATEESIGIAIVHALRAITSLINDAPNNLRPSSLHVLCSSIYGAMAHLDATEIHPTSISGFHLMSVIGAMVSITKAQDIIGEARYISPRPRVWLNARQFDDVERLLTHHTLELGLEDY